MQIKTQVGKLALSKPWYELIELEETTNGFVYLVPGRAHIHLLDQLPFHHKDPFDRLLIAQAIHDDLTLISNDRAFSSYPVEMLW